MQTFVRSNVITADERRHIRVDEIEWHSELKLACGLDFEIADGVVIFNTHFLNTFASFKKKRERIEEQKKFNLFLVVEDNRHKKLDSRVTH